MYEDVYLVDDNLSLVTLTALNAIEDTLGLTLPSGYKALLTTLGEGTYCFFVRTVSPTEIVARTEELRAMLKTRNFWKRGNSVLSERDMASAIVIADSIDSDFFIYSPSTDHGVYVLPRHDDTIYWVSPDFRRPLEWHSEEGLRRSEPSFRFFEPGGERDAIELFTAKESFEVRSLVSSAVMQLSGGKETRVQFDRNVALLFVKALGARIHFQQAPGDRRVGITIVLNPKHRLDINDYLDDLVSNGFFLLS